MLTKSTEYGLRAMVYIQLKNWDGQRPGILEIAREIESPAAFTAKILQMLTRHGLLSSMKGRGGGFFFNEDDEDINLYQLVLVMEGNRFEDKCGFGLKYCSDDRPCPLHDRYIKIQNEFVDILKHESIQSLATKIKDGEAVLNRIIN